MRKAAEAEAALKSLGKAGGDASARQVTGERQLIEARRQEIGALKDKMAAVDTTADAYQRYNVQALYGGRSDMGTHLADMRKQLEYETLLNRQRWQLFTTPQQAYAWRQTEYTQKLLMNRAEWAGYFTADQYLGYLQKQVSLYRQFNAELEHRSALYKANTDSALAYYNAIAGSHRSVSELSVSSTEGTSALAAAIAGVPAQVVTRLDANADQGLSVVVAWKAELASIPDTVHTAVSESGKLLPASAVVSLQTHVAQADLAAWQDALNSVPDTVGTVAGFSGGKAMASLDAWKKALAGTPDVLDTTADFRDMKARTDLEAWVALLNRVPDHTVTDVELAGVRKAMADLEAFNAYVQAHAHETETVTVGMLAAGAAGGGGGPPPAAHPAAAAAAEPGPNSDAAWLKYVADVQAGRLALAQFIPVAQQANASLAAQAAQDALAAKAVASDTAAQQQAGDAAKALIAVWAKGGTARKALTDAMSAGTAQDHLAAQAAAGLAASSDQAAVAAAHDAAAQEGSASALQQTVAAASAAKQAQGSTVPVLAAVTAAVDNSSKSVNFARGFWGLWTREIQLFGGVFGKTALISSISVWALALHTLLDFFIVLIPAVIGAAAAIGAFSLAAAAAAQDIVQHLNGVHTAMSALGTGADQLGTQYMGPLTAKMGSLNATVKQMPVTIASMQDAMAPTVVTLYGAAINSLGNNMALVQGIAKKTGSFFVDTLVKVSSYVQGHGNILGPLITTATNDLHILGSIGLSFLKIFSEFLKAGELTHISELLFGAIAYALSLVTKALNAIGPQAAAAALGFFAVVHYGGLLTTGLVSLVRLTGTLAGSLGSLIAKLTGGSNAFGALAASLGASNDALIKMGALTPQLKNVGTLLASGDAAAISMAGSLGLTHDQMVKIGAQNPDIKEMASAFGMSATNASENALAVAASGKSAEQLATDLGKVNPELQAMIGSLPQVKQNLAFMGTVGSDADAAEAGIAKLGGAAAAAEPQMAGFAGTLKGIKDGFTGIPLSGWLAIGAAILAIGYELYKAGQASKQTTDDINKLNAALDGLSASQQFTQLQSNLAALTSQVNTDLKQQGDIVQANLAHYTQNGNGLLAFAKNLITSIVSGGADMTQAQANTAAAQAALTTQQKDWNNTIQATAYAIKRYGVTGEEAFTLMDLAGVKVSDDLGQQKGKIDALVAGWVNMGVQGYQLKSGMNQLGNSINAVQLASEITSSKITALTGDFKTFFSLVTGGETGLETFLTNVGTVSTNSKSASASMNGLDASSLTLRQSWEQAAASAQSLYSQLQLQNAAAGNTSQSYAQLQRAGQDLVNVLLAQGDGSKEATNAAYALAQQMGYTGKDTYAALVQWSGGNQKASDTTKDLNKQVGLLETAASNLQTDTLNLSQAINTNLNKAVADAIVDMPSLTKKVSDLAQVITQSQATVKKGIITPQEVTSAQAVGNALIAIYGTTPSGLANAKGEFLTTLSALGVSRANSLTLWQDTLNKYNNTAGLNTLVPRVNTSQLDAFLKSIGISVPSKIAAINKLVMDPKASLASIDTMLGKLGLSAVQIAGINRTLLGPQDDVRPIDALLKHLGLPRSAIDAINKLVLAPNANMQAIDSLLAKLKLTPAQIQAINKLILSPKTEVPAYLVFYKNLGLTPAQIVAINKLKIGPGTDFATYDAFYKSIGLTPGQIAAVNKLVISPQTGFSAWDSFFKQLGLTPAQISGINKLDISPRTSLAAIDTMLSKLGISQADINAINSTIIKPKVDFTSADAAFQQFTQEILGSPTANMPPGLPGLPLKHAAGGYVPGAGEGDIVPAMLTPGEYVIQKPARQALEAQYGPGVMDQLNQAHRGGAGQLTPEQQAALKKKQAASGWQWQGMGQQPAGGTQQHYASGGSVGMQHYASGGIVGILEQGFQSGIAGIEAQWKRAAAVMGQEFDTAFGNVIKRFFATQLPAEISSDSAAWAKLWKGAGQEFTTDVEVPAKTFFTGQLPGWAKSAQGPVSGMWSAGGTALAKDVAGPAKTFFTGELPGWAKSAQGSVSGIWSGSQAAFAKDVAGPVQTFFTGSLKSWAGTAGTEIDSAWSGSQAVFAKDVTAPVQAFFTGSLKSWAGTAGTEIDSAWSGSQAVFAKDVTAPAQTFFTSSIKSWAGTAGTEISSTWSGSQTAFAKDVAGPVQTFFTSSLKSWTGTAGTELDSTWSGSQTAFAKDVNAPAQTFFTSSLKSWTGTAGTELGSLWSGSQATFAKDVDTPVQTFFTSSMKSWTGTAQSDWQNLWSSGASFFTAHIETPVSTWLTQTLAASDFSKVGAAWQAMWQLAVNTAFRNNVESPVTSWLTQTLAVTDFSRVGASWQQMWQLAVNIAFRNAVENPVTSWLTQTLAVTDFSRVGASWGQMWQLAVNIGFRNDVENPLNTYFGTTLPNSIRAGFRSAFLWVIQNPVRDVYSWIKSVATGAGISVPPAPSTAGLASGGDASRAAQHGSVAGGGEHDSVAAMLMPGEFVVRKSARMAMESAYGPGVMHEINRADSSFGAGSRGIPASQDFRASRRRYAFGGYVDPIPGGVSPARIDQGVDFIGSGNILAIGAGRIIETNGGGWPGGPFMSYQLTSGPASGRYVYVAENIRPTVKAGQTVSAGQVIATMFNGGTGIETGWGSGGGTSTLAKVTGGYTEGEVTAAGHNFDELLVQLGAPKAPNFGAAPIGTLPAGWGPGGGGVTPGAGAAPAGNPAAAAAAQAQISALNAQLAALAKVDAGLAARIKADEKNMSAAGWVSSVGIAGLADLQKDIDKEVAAKTASDKSALASAQSALTAASAPPSGGGTIPSGPAGGATGSRLANATQGYNYLLKNLFGGQKVAAAGAVASIDGESSWNPASQGTGGRGLIGWTPPSTISNAAFSGGMATQLPAIIQFVNSSGDGAAITSMIGQTSLSAAAQIWDSRVERAGINDVHAAGLAMAASIAGIPNNAAGGLVIPGAASGGVVAGSGMQNLLTIARFLETKNYTRAAAAGIAGDIFGESAGNPESVGSGGFGLIGWTGGNTIGLPAGYRGPTGSPSTDLAIQMNGVVGYINALGGPGPIIAAGDGSNYTAAGQVFSASYERPAVRFSDTRPSVAATIFSELGGSTAPPPPSGGGSTPPPSGGGSRLPAGVILMFGSVGAMVKTLQANLNKWAVKIGLRAPLAVDGIFGPLTRAAVVLAQVYFGQRGIAAGDVTQSLYNVLLGTTARRGSLAPGGAVTPPPSGSGSGAGGGSAPGGGVSASGSNFVPPPYPWKLSSTRVPDSSTKIPVPVIPYAGTSSAAWNAAEGAAWGAQNRLDADYNAFLHGRDTVRQPAAVQHAFDQMAHMLAEEVTYWDSLADRSNPAVTDTQSYYPVRANLESVAAQLESPSGVRKYLRPLNPALYDHLHADIAGAGGVLPRIEAEMAIWPGIWGPHVQPGTKPPPPGPPPRITPGPVGQVVSHGLPDISLAGAAGTGGPGTPVAGPGSGFGFAPGGLVAPSLRDVAGQFSILVPGANGYLPVALPDSFGRGLDKAGRSHEPARSLSEAAAAQSRIGVNVAGDVVVHNPVPEKVSESLARAGNRLAFLAGRG